MKFVRRRMASLRALLVFVAMVAVELAALVVLTPVLGGTGVGDQRASNRVSVR